MTEIEKGPYEESEHLTVFMLAKTTTERLAMSADQQSASINDALGPLLETHGHEVRLRLFDSEFYSARVTDIWVWEVKHRKAYEMIVEALRSSPICDKLFTILEILPSVEDLYPTQYGRGATALS